MRLTVLAALLVVSLGTDVASAQSVVGASRTVPPQVVPGQYIVELQPGAAADTVLRRHRLAPRARWRIINGFAARMPDAAASRLAMDPLVKSVAPDLVVEASPRATTGRRVPDTPAICPLGVAPASAPGVKVAVLDTGIDDCHPELTGRVKGGINIVDPSRPPLDDHGHGTDIAAGMSGRGIVPGVSLYAVKVLNAAGRGLLSDVITGIDWAARHGMHVANVSLGALDAWCYYFGICGASAECSAISNAAAAGMTVIVAGGHPKGEAAFYTPANCADSIALPAPDPASGTRLLAEP
ncbi:MAG: S8 family serine peptidase [Candidatus Rokubacteria bacterium]|nr:S8 family serine peptidase [Candidatus Rokubacteria bacterium]